MPSHVFVTYSSVSTQVIDTIVFKDDTTIFSVKDASSFDCSPDSFRKLLSAKKMVIANEFGVTSMSLSGNIMTVDQSAEGIKSQFCITVNLRELENVIDYELNNINTPKISMMGKNIKIGDYSVPLNTHTCEEWTKFLEFNHSLTMPDKSVVRITDIDDEITMIVSFGKSGAHYDVALSDTNVDQLKFHLFDAYNSCVNI